MKLILCILLAYQIVSCSSEKPMSKMNCNENKNFKIIFFKHINNIEAYTLRTKNKENKEVDLTLFKLSLKEISAYVSVNYSLLANYEFGYSSEEVFKKEKKRWLSWYEENKCKNLQWKKNQE